MRTPALVRDPNVMAACGPVKPNLRPGALRWGQKGSRRDVSMRETHDHQETYFESHRPWYEICVAFGGYVVKEWAAGSTLVFGKFVALTWPFCRMVPETRERSARPTMARLEKGGNMRDGGVDGDATATDSHKYDHLHENRPSRQRKQRDDPCYRMYTWPFAGQRPLPLTGRPCCRSFGVVLGPTETRLEDAA